MKEEQITKAMRGFVKAMVEQDVSKVLSFCNEDVIWVTPNGTFKGKAGVRKYIEWTSARVADQKVIETGIKVMGQGNIGIYEHVIGGTVDDKDWESKLDKPSFRATYVMTEDYEDLQTSLDSVQKELQNVRTLTYVLFVITIALAGSTAYLAKKRTSFKKINSV